MPFNGSGGFDRVPNGAKSWQMDRDALTKIKADLHDTHDEDLAAGLSQCITKNGETQPLANIPMNEKRLVNLGEPVDPQDAATRHFVETMAGWTTSKSISGADADGRLNFTSPAGVNGIGWAAADLSWLAKVGDPDKTSARLVMNDTMAGGSGSKDVVILDEFGHFNTNGEWTWNLSWDGDEWRTIDFGLATRIDISGGNFKVGGLDAATTLDQYKPAPLRDFFSAVNNSGSPYLNLFKSASAKVAAICGHMGVARRWLMYLGDQTAEVAPATGSDFQLFAYDNDGTTIHTAMKITRSTRAVDFYGNVKTTGQITFNSILQSSDTSCILAAANGGSVYLRPNGNASASEQVYVSTGGDLIVSGVSGSTVVGGTYAGYGIKEKQGYLGSFGTQWMNLLYVGSGDCRIYADSVHVGTVPAPSDHRLKRDIKPLTRQWDKVKQLRPVAYQWKTVDGERWGFIAHELQQDLIPGAASGTKDMDEGYQSPDHMAVIAALTSALQEAMLRIEALEAKLK